MEDDVYKTIAGPIESVFKDRSSKFLAFAYPVQSAEDAKQYLAELRKKYYDATHHCYAYRIGPTGETYRVNDDGEPSGTAGRPILGQMMSSGVTDCLIVVVRYFGGTKLGVPGLINAYRESAAAAIAAADVVERTVDTIFEVTFPYVSMNEVMKIIKDEQPRVISQKLDNLCSLVLAVRRSCANTIESKMTKVEGVLSERIEKNDAATK